MFRGLKYFDTNRGRRRAIFAGVLAIAATLAMAEAVYVFSVPPGTILFTLIAVAIVLGVCLVASMSARIRQKMSEQNLQLDVALNNINQGLCMFDAQNRLVVWNERYRDMYNIDPRHIWRGCAIRDLLDARIAAGTFPLDPARYDQELRSALKERTAFTLNIELKDGRTIAVVNQPMKDGGWVATHEDITERKRAERELERTRSFLDTIIENVPSPIIVKNISDLRYLLINRAAEKYLGVDRSVMLGKTAGEVMPRSSADKIEAEDQKLIEIGGSRLPRRTRGGNAGQWHPHRHRNAAAGEGHGRDAAISHQRDQ